MKFFVHWFVSSLAIIISAYLLPGVRVDGLESALVLAVALGVINAFVRPILILITLPLTVMTFGLFLLVINTLLIMGAAAVVPGFSVSGFWWALLFGVVLALVSSFFRGITQVDR